MFGIASSLWQNHLAMREPGLGPFRPLTRPAGYLIILYTGAPMFLLLGWLDQNRLLPPILKLLAAGSSTARTHQLLRVRAPMAAGCRQGFGAATRREAAWS